MWCGCVCLVVHRCAFVCVSCGCLWVSVHLCVCFKQVHILTSPSPAILLSLVSLPAAWQLHWHTNAFVLAKQVYPNGNTDCFEQTCQTLSGVREKGCPQAKCTATLQASHSIKYSIFPTNQKNYLCQIINPIYRIKKIVLLKRYRGCCSKNNSPTFDTIRHTNKPWKHFIQWRKSNANDHILWSHLHEMSRNDSTETESRLVLLTPA